MYPGDLTDRQWFRLSPPLNEPRGGRHAGGRPRKHAQRRVVDALLYVVKTGCQWRQLPSDFPPWKTVHEHFRAWRDSGVWERIGQTLREQGRKAGGRNAKPTVAIIDSQSARAARLRCGQENRRAKDMFDYSVEIVQRNEQHMFRILPKRWIVQRTFAGLNWSRRLSKDYELRHTSAETMIHISFAHLLLRPSP